MKRYLDPSIIKDFRELINSSEIFYEQKEHRARWNLTCVLMDRIDSAIEYLNNHSEQPKSEEEFIFLIVFACIIKDGVYKFFEKLYKKRPSTINKKKWFSKARRFDKPFFTKETCPTDDVFFEYMRSLAFAHPFDTSRSANNKRLFMKQGEVHMSPWVFCNSAFQKEKSVGLRIYTNGNEEHDTIDLFISYENFKGYVRERYELINEFISWGTEVIEKQNNEWLKIKINRNAGPVDVLKEVKQVLESRFVDEYSLDDAIAILEYEPNNSKNSAVINTIKERLLSKIDKMCDAVDTLNNEALEEELDYMWKRPRNLHSQAHYQLEKTFDYLEDERGECLPYSNEEWGLIQAKEFYDQYASKYVYIDFKNMQYKEIKLLIRAACILGWEEENKSEYIKI